jgi:hypothetical protein
MKAIILAALFLVLWLVWSKQSEKETFSLEFKTALDGKMVKFMNVGASQLIQGVSNQASSLGGSVVSILPFKDKIRQWHRRWRRKNM